MKRKLLIAGLLLGLALLLAGCSPKAPDKVAEPEATAPVQQPALQPATNVPLPDDFDATAEEDQDREYIDPSLAGNVNAPPAQQQPASKEYAGATPILLNPIDLPTPTKAPPMTFTYASYTANKLSLTFEAVAGYIVDDSDSSSYKLTEPDEMVKDKVPVVIQLSIRPVNNSYKAADIPADLRASLKEIGAVNYQRWEPSNTAARTLMNAPGHYANYRGVLTDGTVVRGRIHMALLPNNRLLTLQISNPANYNTDYENVYGQIRRTLKTL